MSAPGSFITSSVGRKWIMAVTGLILFGFVIIHMIGNLQIFLGPEAMNHYGEWLREIGHGAGLWVARGVLLASVLLHIWAAVSLARENQQARPVGYRRLNYRSSDYASRTMIWSGPLLALFIVYHLLHLTTGQVHPNFIAGDVYHNFIVGFSDPLVTGFYVLAMLALGLHLYHGAWSMLQTMGLSHPHFDRFRRPFAVVFTLVVVGGNIVMPLAVLAGMVR